MVVKVQQSFLTETVICMLKIFQSQQSFLTETAICMLNDGGKLWVAVLFLESLACRFFSLFSCHIWKTMATWRNDFSSHKSHLLMKVLLISSTWMVVVSGFRPTADSWCVNINLGILPFIRCREKAPGPFIGGPLVDQAVNAVFAALVWHSQELRDQIVLFCKLIVFYLALFSSLLPRCHKSECSM